MARFAVRLTKSAADDPDALPPETRKRIGSDLHGLETDPYPLGEKTKKLRGFHPALHRMRSGDFRIIYRLQDETIFILRILDRKNLKRIIKRLKF
jgi:mRNA-degrading endonuclease RelE of RelBE toxin-antitoxin system